MRNAKQDPYFGLASTREPSRASAMNMMERLHSHVQALHERLGRPIIRALHLHSSPTNNFSETRGNVQAFERSLREINAMGWGDISLHLEHCDSQIDHNPPDKGFLPLQQELELISSFDMGVVLNWGRSAIEARSPDGPLKHLEQVCAADALRGFFFSGCTGLPNGDYGVWRDTHMPAAPVIDSPYLRHESLLGAAEIKACLRLLREYRGGVYLGVKVLDPASEMDLTRKLYLNLDTIRAVASVHTESASECSS